VFLLSTNCLTSQRAARLTVWVTSGSSDTEVRSANISCLSDLDYARIYERESGLHNSAVLSHLEAS
jgi:hypothetical protein